MVAVVVVVLETVAVVDVLVAELVTPICSFRHPVVDFGGGGGAACAEAVCKAIRSPRVLRRVYALATNASVSLNIEVMNVFCCGRLNSDGEY